MASGDSTGAAGLSTAAVASSTSSANEDKKEPASSGHGSKVQAARSDIADVLRNEILVLTAVGKVQAMKKWKEKMLNEKPPPKEEFEKALHDTMVFSTSVFGLIRPAGEQCHSLSDELAEAIIGMRNHLGEEIMPLSEEPYFSRAMFEVSGKTLIARQYFEPLPFYGPPRKPSPDDILKFYEWQYLAVHPKEVKGGVPIQCTFYLEKGVPQFTGPSFYALGMIAPGMHATLETYHEKPSFYDLEKSVIKRVEDDQQGNDSGFATASFYDRR